MPRRGFLKFLGGAVAAGAGLAQSKEAQAMLHPTVPNSPADLGPPMEEIVSPEIAGENGGEKVEKHPDAFSVRDRLKKGNPDYFEGIKNLGSWTDAEGRQHMRYQSVSITQSGAWIIEQEVSMADDDISWAPVPGTLRLIKVLEHWGPHSFEEDMRLRLEIPEN